MVTSKILSGSVVSLRQIETADCNDNYVRWLNDREVIQYMETRWQKQDIGSVREFVRSQRENDHSILFAVTLNQGEKRHIGNIKIGPVHPRYHYADISYFIGEKALWGTGCATEAVKLVCGFGFSDLHLHRIEAGTYECALGSQRTLEKNGFVREGIFRDRVLFEGRYIDVYRYALAACDCKTDGNRRYRNENKKM